MPIYEYKCLDCGAVIEVLQGVGSKSDELVCKVCNGKKLEKVFSVMSVGKGSTGSQSPCGGSCPVPGAGAGGSPCSGGSCPF